jgi:hypothetical protein
LGTTGQQNVFVSYEVDENNFFIPYRKLFVCFAETETPYGDILLNEHNFGLTSLRQFIQGENQDYDTLIFTIENEDLWDVCN